jgi:steroid 5-alpha reductase family enzyme
MEGLLGVDESVDNICLFVESTLLCSFVRISFFAHTNHSQYYGALCKWLATFDCLSMFDENQIPNSGSFEIFIILSVVTLISGLTTVLFFM